MKDQQNNLVEITTIDDTPHVKRFINTDNQEIYISYYNKDAAGWSDPVPLTPALTYIADNVNQQYQSLARERDKQYHTGGVIGAEGKVTINDGLPLSTDPFIPNPEIQGLVKPKKRSTGKKRQTANRDSIELEELRLTNSTLQAACEELNASINDRDSIIKDQRAELDRVHSLMRKLEEEDSADEQKLRNTVRSLESLSERNLKALADKDSKIDKLHEEREILSSKYWSLKREHEDNVNSFKLFSTSVKRVSIILVLVALVSVIYRGL